MRGRDGRPPVWLPLSIVAAVLLASAVALHDGWLLVAGLTGLAAAGYLYADSRGRTREGSGQDDHLDVGDWSSNGRGLDRET